MKKDFLHINDLTKDDFLHLMEISKWIKMKFKSGEAYTPFNNKSMARPKLVLTTKQYWLLLRNYFVT